jgi:DnaJ-class molecular chaperone
MDHTRQLGAQAQLKLAPDAEAPAPGTDPDRRSPYTCPECSGTGQVQVKDGVHGVCPGCWEGEVGADA